MASSSEARQRYARQWETVQSQFVDSPPTAITAADGLVSAVMADRGYPIDDFDQRAADVSVDHPAVVENYRQAHEISMRSARGEATTEELRQAMQHTLLPGVEIHTADKPLARDADSATYPDQTAATENKPVTSTGRTVQQ